MNYFLGWGLTSRVPKDNGLVTNLTKRKKENASFKKDEN